MIKSIVYDFTYKALVVTTEGGTVSVFTEDDSASLFGFLEMNAIRQNLGVREEPKHAPSILPEEARAFLEAKARKTALQRRARALAAEYMRKFDLDQAGRAQAVDKNWKKFLPMAEQHMEEEARMEITL